MLITRININIFKEFISNLMIVADEVILNINDNGFVSKAIDISNVAMISIELEKEIFDFYELKSEKFSVGIDLLKIYEVINEYKNDDQIYLEINNKTNKINIKFNNISYSTSLLDTSTIRMEPNMPNINYFEKVLVNGLEFKKAVKIADRINDYLVIELENKNLYIKSKNETDQISLCINSKSINQNNSNYNKTVSSIYSTDYLLNLTKTLGKIENIILSIDQDYPLFITFNIYNKYGSVFYFLAPRIESD